MNSVRFTNCTKFNPDDSCPICFDSLKKDDADQVTAHALPNSNDEWHAVHQKCIDAWAQVHPVCPVCRENISLISVTKIPTTHIRTSVAPTRYFETAKLITRDALFGAIGSVLGATIAVGGETLGVGTGLLLGMGVGACTTLAGAKLSDKVSALGIGIATGTAGSLMALAAQMASSRSKISPETIALTTIAIAGILGAFAGRTYREI